MISPACEGRIFWILPTQLLQTAPGMFLVVLLCLPNFFWLYFPHAGWWKAYYCLLVKRYIQSDLKNPWWKFHSPHFGRPYSHKLNGFVPKEGLLKDDESMVIKRWGLEISVLRYQTQELSIPRLEIHCPVNAIDIHRVFSQPFSLVFQYFSDQAISVLSSQQCTILDQHLRQSLSLSIHIYIYTHTTV